MIFSYPYSFDDRWRKWNEAKTDYVEGRISTSIGQAERSVPDDVKRKRKKRWRWLSARGWLRGTGKRRYRVSGITKNTWSAQCDWVRTAALSHSPRFVLTTSVLKQREVPATDSSSYVSPLYTAMFRTSIAAVVLGCCYFCPLDCDAPVWWLTALLL